MYYRQPRNKYGNKKVELDGRTFDSRKEAKYYVYLRELERQGVIENLRCQVPYELIPAVYETQTVHLKTKDKTVEKCVQKAVHYVADFVYTIVETGREEVVDVKGGTATITKEFTLKKKMMRYFHNIDIIVV